MDNENIIKFSHKYKKLHDANGSIIENAILLDVIKVNLEDLSKDFLDFDTDNGLFELPETGVYSMLIFKKTNTNDIFTTLRKWSQEKFDFYKSKTGSSFKIQLKPGC